jgi:uncharacterized membrane protein
MSLGYCVGALFELPLEQRVNRFAWLGTASLVAFVVLRATNLYGDPSPWAVQSTTLNSLLAFVNVQKYPPSLDYLLMTLGAAFLALAVLAPARGAVSEVLQTFGRVPLFFYVLHIALAHVVAEIVGTPAGFDLPIVYLAWALVLAILYPACRWFAGVKRRRSDWWLSYL